MKFTDFLQTRLGFTIYLVVTVVLGFLIIEAGARFIAVPVSYDFIERRIQEQGLTPKKKRDEFRIFLFGESTMHGHVYYPESSIARWMELYFEEALDPQEAKKIKVYNFGRLGAVSDFMLDAYRETLAYQPDMVVFYSAHNDFCVGWEWPSVRARRPFGEKFTDFMRAGIRPSVFIGLFRRMSVSAKLERKKSQSKKEMEDKGWYVRISLKQQFHQKDLLYKNSDEFRNIEKRWKGNIREMIKIAQKRNIHIAFFKGISNYKYFEPFKSVNRADLTGDALIAWRQLQVEGEDAMQKGDYLSAVRLLKKALAIDDQFAKTYYLLGQAYEQLTEYDRAKEYYFLANEHDRFPIRAPGEVNAFYNQLEAQNLDGVYIIDTPKVFEDVSPSGIVDSRTIIDAVHPNIYGQSLMAKSVVETIFKNNILRFNPQWRWNSVRNWKEMFNKIQWTDDRLFESYCEMATYVGSYYEPAVAYMEKAVKIKQDSVYARTLLAWLYWKIGKQEKALDLYVKTYQEGALIPDGFKEHYREIYDKILEKAEQ